MRQRILILVAALCLLVSVQVLSEQQVLELTHVAWPAVGPEQREGMDGPGHRFLSGACLALNQGGRLVLGDAAY